VLGSCVLFLFVDKAFGLGLKCWLLVGLFCFWTGPLCLNSFFVFGCFFLYWGQVLDLGRPIFGQVCLLPGSSGFC